MYIYIYRYTINIIQNCPCCFFKGRCCWLHMLYLVSSSQLNVNLNKQKKITHAHTFLSHSFDGLCLTLFFFPLMSALNWILHLWHAFFSDSAFQILPSRLQLFEYESVYFTCNGFNISAEWKVRNIEQIVSKCSTNTTMKTCTIDYAFVSDSGEYWCESGAERSNTINITVSSMFSQS